MAKIHEKLVAQELEITNLKKQLSEKYMTPDKQKLREAIAWLNGFDTAFNLTQDHVDAVNTLLSLATQVLVGSIFASEEEIVNILEKTIPDLNKYHAYHNIASALTRLPRKMGEGE